jgi:hypothetical protein
VRATSSLHDISSMRLRIIEHDVNTPISIASSIATSVLSLDHVKRTNNGVAKTKFEEELCNLKSQMHELYMMRLKSHVLWGLYYNYMGTAYTHGILKKPILKMEGRLDSVITGLQTSY